MRKDNNKKILILADYARSFLYVHGFIPESQNQKLADKIKHFQLKHRLDVSKEELIKVLNEFYEEIKVEENDTKNEGTL